MFLNVHWRIQGRGPGDPPPLLLDQSETQRAEKKIFGHRPPPPSYLKVWISHLRRSV